MSLISRLAPLSLSLLAALPAHAQDAPQAQAEDAAPAAVQPMCSGLPAQWLGESSDTSDISTAESPLSQQMTTSQGNHPYAMFRVTGALQAVRLEAQSDGDPSLRLETPEGDVLAENDDAVGLDSRIEQSVGPGDYCVRLVPVGDSAMTATLQVSNPDMPALLHGQESMSINSCLADTPSQPFAETALDSAMPVRVQTENSVRYLRFTMDGNTGVTLRAVSQELDPNMVLFDGTGQKIAENDDADGLNSRLDFPNGLAAGDYCLGVGPLSSGQGVIEVSAEALDRDSYLRGAWRRGELAPSFDSDFPMQPLDLATERDTVVLLDGSAQWLTFTLEREAVMIISAYGELVGVDAKLALFSQAGAIVDQADDVAGSTDPRLGPLLLPAGRYRLAVSTYSDSDRPGSPIKPVGMVFELFERVD